MRGGKSSRLSDISTGRLTAPSIEKNDNPQKPAKSDAATQNNKPDLLTQLKPFLDLITEKLTKIENDCIKSNSNTIPNEIQDKTITKTASLSPNNDLCSKLVENISQLHAKIDSRLPKNFNKVLSDHKTEITVKLDSLDLKLDGCKPGNSRAKNIASNYVSTPVSKPTKSNPLDWTMLFNQSSCVSQTDNMDLYPLLTGFEQNTWASLDHLKDKIIENNELILSIRSTLSSLDQPSTTSASHSNTASNDSALVNAINSDIVHDIRNKCENIENKVDKLIEYNDTMKEASSVTSPITGNPTTMSMQKEAMTHNNNSQIAPEKSKQMKQKRLSPDSSGGWPGNDLENDSNSIIETIINEIQSVAIISQDDSALEILHKSDPTVICSPMDDLALNKLTDSSVISGKESLALEALEKLSQNTEDLSYRSISIESIHNLSGSEGIVLASAETTHKTSATSNLIIDDTVRARDNRTYHSLHLSHLPINITENVISDYIKAKGICDTDGIKITKLVKRDADPSLFTFISFKIDSDEATHAVLSDKSFWPNNCKIKDFEHKTRLTKPPKTTSVASSENFLAISQSIKVAT